jgi:FkbM family methyltransferase
MVYNHAALECPGYLPAHGLDTLMKPQPFGVYALLPWQQSLLNVSQRQPVSWLGRRLALILRRIILGKRTDPIDAEVENLHMRVHVTDNVSERKFLFMPRFCDPAERAYVGGHLSPDGMFLDIGANAGIYTLTAARVYARMGGAGQVLAVEANPTMQARLNFNVELNGLQPQVRLAPLALSDQSGEVEFTVSDTNLGESGLNTPGSTKLRVPCKTLAELLRDEAVRKVDGMKIDVEGMEDVILTPFFETAERGLFPGFIVIENSAHLWRSDLLGLLARVGYREVGAHKMNLILALERAD